MSLEYLAVSQLSKDKPLTFQSVAIFPWDESSLDTAELRESWKKLVSDYWDAIAVGSEHSLYVFFTNKKRQPLCVKLPEARLTLEPGLYFYCQYFNS